MTLICFASQKGSPGATLTALVTAAAWPTETSERLLLEADPSGGVLAVRYQLGLEPGLVTLAAGVRAGLAGEEVSQHARELPGGLRAVVGPDGPDQAHLALAASAEALGAILAERRDLDVIADLGRLGPESPAMALASRAQAVLMVARPIAEQLQPTAKRMAAIAPTVRHLGWVLIGDGPHSPDEIESAYGFRVTGVMPHDPRTAAAIESGGSAGRIRRSPLARAGSSLATMMATWVRKQSSEADEGEPIDLHSVDDRHDSAASTGGPRERESARPGSGDHGDGRLRPQAEVAPEIAQERT